MRSASAAGCTHHPDQVLAARIVKENIALPVAAEGTYPDDVTLQTQVGHSPSSEKCQ